VVVAIELKLDIAIFIHGECIPKIYNESRKQAVEAYIYHFVALILTHKRKIFH
jgi:hypothetical protein